MPHILKITILGFVAVLLVTLPASAREIGVEVNGAPVSFGDQEPIIEGARVMVPLRGVMERLGARVAWDGSERSVTTTRDGDIIKLVVGNPTAQVNGAAATLDTPPLIRGGRTLIPLRFLAEAVGAEVQWESAHRLVRISLEGPETRPGGQTSATGS